MVDNIPDQFFSVLLYEDLQPKTLLSPRPLCATTSAYALPRCGRLQSLQPLSIFPLYYVLTVRRSIMCVRARQPRGWEGRVCCQCGSTMR